MQSQGIGKILLNYAKDKRNKLYLNVYQKNARAISFYKREGFEIQHSGLDEATGERLCNDMATQIEIPVCRPKTEYRSLHSSHALWCLAANFFFERSSIE